MSSPDHTRPQLGCTVLYPDCSNHRAESTVDVVAIPGLGAHPDWTWTYTNKEAGRRPVNWLEDPDMLPAAIPNARIMRFGYESTWIGAGSIHQRLSLIGEQLLRSLENQRQECRTRPIVFIAHSMGGNVLQKALLSAQLHSEKSGKGFDDILKSTTGIVFLGTPFRGSNTAGIAQILAGIASIFIEADTSLINQIESNSESLRDLLYDFCLLINSKSIPIFCFFEQHKTDIARIARRKLSLFPAYHGFMVDEVSACIDGFFKVALAADHLNMNKFQSPEDNNYRLVSQEIQRLVHQAAGCIEARLNPRKLVQDESLVQKEYQQCLHAFLTYTNWLNSELSWTLWIHGDPGKGKTSMTIALVAELSSRVEHSSGPNSILAYFFCDNKDNRTDSAVAILRGLLYQILCQQPGLIYHLKSEYDKQESQLFESRNALQTLWRIIQNTLLQSTLDRVYFVVDGLDECDQESRTVFLRLMEKYIGEGLASSKTGPVVKWILTSRTEVDIKEALINSLDISLEENSVSVEYAVSKFIDVKVEQLRKKKLYPKKLQELIQEILRKKAGGTFLWVSLACAELRDTPAIERNIRKALDSLPRGLPGTYNRILERTIVDNGTDAADIIKNILKAVSVAIRPLTLHELAVIADIPKECWKDRHSLNEYVSQCGSLLTIRKSTNSSDQSLEYEVPRHATVHLVHQSAKDFLISSSSKLFLSSGFAEENSIVAKRCLSYICGGVFASPPINLGTHFFRHRSNYQEKGGSPENFNSQESSKENDDASRDQSAEQEVDLLEYPLIHWMSHGRAASPDVGDVFDAHHNFFEPKSAIRESWMTSCRSISTLTPNYFNPSSDFYLNKKPSASTGLHLGAYSGIYPLVKRLLDWNAMAYPSQADCLINAKDSNDRTPLMRAAMCGHEMVTKLLLERGADATATDEVGDTALSLSSKNGGRDVAQVLLDYGALVNTQCKYGSTALINASGHGNDAIVKLLLQRDADMELCRKNLMTALMMSADNGHTAVVQLLLDKGAHVNRREWQGHTALMRAAQMDHYTVVELLLRYGADVEASDSNSETALTIAARRGHRMIVQLLLDKGACVNRIARFVSTGLTSAAANGHYTVAELLLSHGADIEAKDQWGCTALVLTASRGRDTVAKLLLSHGADIEAKDQNERTALMLAAAKDHYIVMVLLLRHGADVNSSDARGYPALWNVAVRGQEEAVDTLLKYGAGLKTQDIVDDDAFPVFCLAVLKHNENILGFLEPKVQEAGYLRQDAKRSYEVLIEVLLEHGIPPNPEKEIDMLAPFDITEECDLWPWKRKPWARRQKRIVPGFQTLVESQQRILQKILQQRAKNLVIMAETEGKGESTPAEPAEPEMPTT